MKFILALVTLAVVGCGPDRTARARYPGASATFDRAAQDPEALEIADQVVAAAGGLERWNKVKQLRWSQSVTNEGKVIVQGEQAWDRWNGRHHARARREEDSDVVVMRSLYDGSGHVYLDRGQRLRKIERGADEAIAQAKDRWEFDTAVLFMPFLLQEPGTKLAYSGEMKTDDGKFLDVLKVTFDPKDPTRTATYFVAVDRESNLIARIEIQKKGRSENERLGYNVLEWIEGDGLKLPGKLENVGLKGEIVTFKNVSISSPDETLYVPPL